MSELRRFRGAGLAMAALLGVGALWWLGDDTPITPERAYQPALFQFEKEDVVGITVVRPDRTIALAQVDGVWRAQGEPWRPSRSMIRRVAYQIHDLTARAVVADGVTDLDAYGVGDDAITVELALRDGRAVKFAVGDPNPTSVSWYVRPLPGDVVYTVKKAALDYYALSLEEFRERRFAWLDADQADAIDVTIGGEVSRFERVGERKWRMRAPVDQRADTEAIRTMLGRTGALKATQFIEDAPADKAKYGLDAPVAVVVIHQGTGEAVTLEVGALVPDADPPERYVFRVEDDTVYAAKDAFLEAYQHSPEELRDKTLVGRHPWDVRSYRVDRGPESIEITHGKDDWRWPDGSPVPGSTPERVAANATEAEAKAFFDAEVPAAGLTPPWATVTLRFDDATSVLSIGAEADGLRYARLGDEPTIYAIEPALASTIDDLFREWARAQER